ncbi:MAG: PIG-L family deacetylase [Chthoniobacterales bacterium]
MIVPLGQHERILIIAPHPDDESLATGGLIQMAVEAGAHVRILYASNGDNNPWPQRIGERKISIGAQDRVRWGEIRKAEALNALTHLGVSKEEDVRFLGYPDQGFTDVLMRCDANFLNVLQSEIEEFEPSVLVLPSLFDRHADHSALSVLIQIALRRMQSSARRIYYLIHEGKSNPHTAKVEMPLAPVKREKKRDAILRHETQMLLSRRRFVGYAKSIETFYEEMPPDADLARHPIVSANLVGGALQLRIVGKRMPFSKSKVLIAMESLTEGSKRWILSLSGRSGRVFLHDAVTGKVLRGASVRVDAHEWNIKIPIAGVHQLDQIFVKWQAPKLFYDRAGWREVSTTSLSESTLSSHSVEPCRRDAMSVLRKPATFWAILSMLAIIYLGVNFIRHIDHPWVNFVDFNGAVWSQSAHNILRAGMFQTEGASSGFYFGPLPIPAAGYYLHHPPLLHLLVTWLFSIFGEHEWAARLLPIGCSLITGIFLWLLVRNCAGERTAAFSVAIFTVLPMELHYGKMVNFEPLVLLLILGGLLSLRYWQISGLRYWKWAFFGALMLGMWVDWAMHLFVLVLCAYWFIRPDKKMRRIAWTLLLSAIVFSVMYIIRIRMLNPGAWDSLASTFVRRIGATSPIHFTETQWANKISLAFKTHFLPVGWLLSIAGAIVILWKKSRDANLRWLGWACASVTLMDCLFVGIFQNDSYIHPYIAFYLIVPVAVLGGVGLDSMTDWFQKRFEVLNFGRNAVTGLACLVLIFIGYSGVEQSNAMKRYFSILDFKVAEPPDLIPKLGETIRENFSPDTCVLCNFEPVYGPQLGYYAQRTLLGNISEYPSWEHFLQNPPQKSMGGVIWMNSANARQLLTELPAGTRNFIEVDNIPFCIWKPSTVASAKHQAMPVNGDKSLRLIN